jgi:DNA-binding Lrp family transcriptional regulator
LSDQGAEIRNFLLRNIPRHPADIIPVAADRFGVTRQAISYHVRKLTAEGLVQARGKTSARRFALARRTTQKAFDLTGLEEHVVWREFVSPQLDDLPRSAKGICQHGVTEMINNAVDHSGGTQVVISVELVGIKRSDARAG